MTTPTNHHMIITDQRGNTVRGKVVYIQTKEERWQEDSAVVHITTADWLDSYRHAAIYITPLGAVTGFFAVISYISEGDLWRFVGTFERTWDDSAQAP